MTAEREFAGFVLPFAAGIFIAAGLGIIRYSYLPAACTASFMMTATAVLTMLHPSRSAWNSALVPMESALIAASGLCVGMFMGFSSEIMDIGPEESAIGLWASGFGHGLGNFIDRIPFENGNTNAVIKALITGERNDIPPAVTAAFRDSGAAHILSLSGFHLGIVYGIVKYSLSILGNRRKAVVARSVAVVTLCGFYTLATGAGPSIVRAFLFILLGEAARLTHRLRSTASLLLSALLIQLALSPSSISSVSFQLSYAAMAGIAYVYPWLRDFWPGKPSDDRPFTSAVRRIWNSAALSIACQLTTGPLAYLYFGTFPRHFLLTNLIAIPLTSLIIPFALLTIALSALGIQPSITLRATEALTQALSAALEIISGM